MTTHTRRKLTDTLDEVIVEDDNGLRLRFLNGVIQMNSDKFIAARGPVNGSCLLIIADYAHYHVNAKEIEAWIATFDGAVRQEGMVVTFDNEADRTAFVLRWS